MAVIYTTTIDGVTLGFDWENQEIQVDDLSSELSAATLKDAIKDAEDDQSSGIVFPDIAEFGNPVTLTGSVSTAQTVILQDQWRILSLATSGTFTVSGGNVVNTNNGADIFSTSNTIPTNNLLSANGVLVETGVSGLTADESTQLELIKQILANGSTTVDNGDGSCTTTVYDSDDQSGGVVGVWDVDDTNRTRTS